jgi:hypothetical protein
VRHRIETDLSLDDDLSQDAQGNGISASRRTRHLKERRRHVAAPVVVVAERVKPRSSVREERAGKRRVERLRAVVASSLTVAAIGAAVAHTGNLPFATPFSDQLVTVQQGTTAMAPFLDDERRRRPPAPVAVPEESASATAKAKATANAMKSATTRAAEATQSTNVRAGVVLDGRRMGGWYAGASGIGVPDGGFQDWLGQPVTIAATWADTSDEVQRNLYSLTAEYKDWKGGIDIAVGGTVLDSGENYAAAASGAYDERWRAAAAVLARTRKDALGPTFVRPWHESNGTWYQSWTVTRENSADYKKAFARYARILHEALPQVYITWSPNWGDHTGLPIDMWYPGDDVVDVVAPDYYDDGNSSATTNVRAWNQEADDLDGNGNPFGVEAWRRFALTHGKPLAFPEWGLNPAGDGSDHPEWIKAVNAWMNQHANTASWQLGEAIPKAAAGTVLYSTYFNVLHGDNAGFTIHGAGANPESSAVFKTLKWGNVKAG